jgi:hypothetical protein
MVDRADLSSVFSYRGAVDPGATVVEVGAEILEVPFWTPEMCAAVIEAAEALGAWQPDPDDPVPGNEVSLQVLSPRLFAHVEDHCFEHVWPRLQTRWPSIEFVGIHDAFVIRYDAVDRPELPLHHDVGQVSASVRLNDGYEGGLLEFPRQGADNRSVPVGHLVAWPSLVTHPHRSSPVTAGVKYGLTIWFAIPGIERV